MIPNPRRCIRGQAILLSQAGAFTIVGAAAYDDAALIAVAQAGISSTPALARSSEDAVGLRLVRERIQVLYYCGVLSHLLRSH